MIPHGSDLLDSSEFSPTTSDLLSILVRVQELWPDAVVEIDSPRRTPPTPIGEVTLEFIPTGALSLMFVYRTRAAYDAWEALGWTEKFESDLLFILATPTSLSIVGGDKVSVEMSLWASRLASDLKTLTASRTPSSA